MKFSKIVLLALMIILLIQTYASENVRKITVTGKSETVLEARQSRSDILAWLEKNKQGVPLP